MILLIWFIILILMKILMKKDTIGKVEKFKENIVQGKKKLKSTEKLIEEKYYIVITID